MTFEEHVRAALDSLPAHLAAACGTGLRADEAGALFRD